MSFLNVNYLYNEHESSQQWFDCAEAVLHCALVLSHRQALLCSAQVGADVD